MGGQQVVTGSWKFDTAAEAEYPLVLCQRIAALISQVAIARGHTMIKVEPRAAQASSQWRVAAGRQPEAEGPFRCCPRTVSKCRWQSTNPVTWLNLTIGKAVLTVNAASPIVFSHLVPVFCINCRPIQGEQRAGTGRVGDLSLLAFP